MISSYLHSTSVFSVSFAVQSTTTVEGEVSVISSSSFAALTTTELDVALDIPISAESNVTLLESLVATADASIEVAVEIDMNTTITVQDVQTITLDAPISPTMVAEMEITMAESISVSAGRN